MSKESGTTSRLVIERTIKASRDAVFAAWTQPDQLAQWFGPETCNASSARCDLRVGGVYSIKMNDADHGEVEVAGTYEEISKPERLAFTWQWQTQPLDEAGVSLVTVEFTEADGGTNVKIIHEGLPEGDPSHEHEKGWTGCLVCLEKLLS